jgi:hypothetical protein
MNAVSASILIVLLLVVCFGSRRWALLAVMAGVFYLTQGQGVDVAGLRLFPIRFVAVFAFARVVVRRELDWSRLNRIDLTLLLLYNYAALVWILTSTEHEAQQFASAIDPTLCYLALRGLFGDLDDLRWVLRAFVVLLVPFTALIYTERLTGQNAFLIVGGYPQLYFRDGVARCMGPFRHASLMGSVAASFLALYIALALGGKRRVETAIGAVLCLVLIVLSNSGGPLTSTGAVFLGWFLWPLRERMFLVRRAAVALLLLFMIFMKAPIWYLPFKISSVVGGGGFHRSLLMEQAWRHLDQWWLVGMDVKDTGVWMPYVLDTIGGGADMTNQFLVFGVRAGLLAVGLLVGVLSLGFVSVGKLLASVRASGDRNTADQLLLWGLGVSLFVHAVSWLGCSYFDQSWVVWLMHLAAVSSAMQAAAIVAPEHSTASNVVQETVRLRPRRFRIRAIRPVTRNRLRAAVRDASKSLVRSRQLWPSSGHMGDDTSSKGMLRRYRRQV